jgi:hypothetical protein
MVIENREAPDDFETMRANTGKTSPARFAILEVPFAGPKSSEEHCPKSQVICKTRVSSAYPSLE